MTDGIKVDLQKILHHDAKAITQVLAWHREYGSKHYEALTYVLEELAFHPELLLEKKISLLTNYEFLQTYHIRKAGLTTVPNEWVDAQTCNINFEVLDDLWLRPSLGRLYRALQKSDKPEDKQRLFELQKSNGFLYREVHTPRNERKTKRLEKLQKSIEAQKVVLFLGRQNRIYKTLQHHLNQQHKGVVQFISDHVWAGRGYIEPGVKSSDNLLSVLQALETIRRLPELPLIGDAISRRRVAFTLDGYDVKHGLSAIYSNPNFVARWKKKPIIEGIDKFAFAFTGLTDLELANIVRNKHWFDFLDFYRTGNDGQPEKLSHIEVAQNYGIKYIGDVMCHKIRATS